MFRSNLSSKESGATSVLSSTALIYHVEICIAPSGTLIRVHDKHQCRRLIFCHVYKRTVAGIDLLGAHAAGSKKGEIAPERKPKAARIKSFTAQCWRVSQTSESKCCHNPLRQHAGNAFSQKAKTRYRPELQGTPEIFFHPKKA